MSGNWRRKGGEKESEGRRGNVSKGRVTAAKKLLCHFCGAFQSLFFLFFFPPFPYKGVKRFLTSATMQKGEGQTAFCPLVQILFFSLLLLLYDT